MIAFRLKYVTLSIRFNVTLKVTENESQVQQSKYASTNW
jgi:hypothetical protein